GSTFPEACEAVFPWDAVAPSGAAAAAAASSDDRYNTEMDRVAVKQACEVAHGGSGSQQQRLHFELLGSRPGRSWASGGGSCWGTRVDRVQLVSSSSGGGSGGGGLLMRLLRAQDTAFEREVFYEMSREAATAALSAAAGTVVAGSAASAVAVSNSIHVDLPPRQLHASLCPAGTAAAAGLDDVVSKQLELLARLALRRLHRCRRQEFTGGGGGGTEHQSLTGGDGGRVSGVLDAAVSHVCRGDRQRAVQAILERAVGAARASAAEAAAASPSLAWMAAARVRIISCSGQRFGGRWADSEARWRVTVRH
ncbi:hypothetical protein HK405_001791, partial [Cladochytrium tenue]